MRVLLVEDEAAIRRDITRALTASGYIVEECVDGEDAWFKGDVEEFDAVVLDLTLPGLDGMQVLKRWRGAGRKIPVIVVSARGTWRERVEGIDAGADDYLPKPFQMEELLSRLQAVIRRTGGQSQSVLTTGPLSLDQRHAKATLRGIPLALTPLEYRLLSCLMLNCGRPVSQVELADHLYSIGGERENNAVEALVGRLRKKLGADLIQTRRGFGYLLEIPGDADAGATEAATRRHRL